MLCLVSTIFFFLSNFFFHFRLHLGHTFAFTKCEFFARFQRLQGKKTLLPFGFHATGMPIQASADKLKIEIETYGNPPVFPVVKKEEKKEDPQDPGAAKGGTKSKTLMKTGGVKWQWKILEAMGVPQTEIPKFRDPLHWLTYFPEYGMQDLKAFGSCVDWRRSFITTEANAYYDSFVQWQYNTLKEMDKFTFGKRFVVWAPKVSVVKERPTQ